VFPHALQKGGDTGAEAAAVILGIEAQSQLEMQFLIHVFPSGTEPPGGAAFFLF
jgi:hypothetical protein